METATDDAIELQRQQNQQTVNKIHINTPAPQREFTHKTAPTKPCFRCEGDHKPDKCRHINTICRFCSYAGHFERACLTKRRSTHQYGQKPNNEGVHMIQELDELDSDE